MSVSARVQTAHEQLGGQANRDYAQGTGSAKSVGAHLSETVMHRARAFFFVCAGLFLLALSYHLGVQNAGAARPLWDR